MGRIEPVSNPVWLVRAKILARVVTEPLSTDELYKKARKELHWPTPIIQHTLVVAEGTYLYEADHKWRKFSNTDELLEVSPVE